MGSKSAVSGVVLLVQPVARGTLLLQPPSRSVGSETECQGDHDYLHRSSAVASSLVA